MLYLVTKSPKLLFWRNDELCQMPFLYNWNNFEVSAMEFVYELHCIIDFRILNQPCFSWVKSTWSDCIIFLVCFWIQLASIRHVMKHLKINNKRKLKNALLLKNTPLPPLCPPSLCPFLPPSLFVFVESWLMFYSVTDFGECSRCCSKNKHCLSVGWDILYISVKLDHPQYVLALKFLVLSLEGLSKFKS